EDTTIPLGERIGAGSDDDTGFYPSRSFGIALEIGFLHQPLSQVTGGKAQHQTAITARRYAVGAVVKTVEPSDPARNAVDLIEADEAVVCPLQHSECVLVRMVVDAPTEPVENRAAPSLVDHAHLLSVVGIDESLTSLLRKIDPR